MMLMMQATGGPASSASLGARSSNLTSSGTPPISKKWCSCPDGLRRLVFKMVRAHDAHFGRFNGPKNASKNPVAWGFASKTRVNFGVVLEGVCGGPLEKRRSNDVGSAALASPPPHGKARAVACGSNPRALPDFLYQ